jgi:hypothetical protein
MPFSIKKTQCRFVEEDDLPTAPKKYPVMGESMGLDPRPIPLPIKENSPRVHIEPELVFLPQAITNLLPLTSGQDAFQFLPGMPLVILNARHVSGLSSLGKDMAGPVLARGVGGRSRVRQVVHQ